MAAELLAARLFIRSNCQGQPRISMLSCLPLGQASYELVSGRNFRIRAYADMDAKRINRWWWPRFLTSRFDGLSKIFLAPIVVVFGLVVGREIAHFAMGPWTCCCCYIKSTLNSGNRLLLHRRAACVFLVSDTKSACSRDERTGLCEKKETGYQRSPRRFLKPQSLQTKTAGA